jgi:hypothetical protein
MSQSNDGPQDLPALDPEEFVGGPPAGEQDPTAFESTDQGDPDSTDAGDDDSASDADPHPDRQAGPDTGTDEGGAGS